MAISKIILNGVTQMDLTADTVANASHIMNGYVGHLVDGTQVTGTGQGSGTLVSKTITLNGTYDPDDDNADGYSSVTVNVQNGASMAEVANTYGTEIVVSSAQGATPSVTRHTLYFEYEDGTTETVYIYYDDTLVGTGITATTPTTRNNKTVTLAQLDGVTWYSYTPTPTPSETWELIHSGDYYPNAEDPYGYFWVSEMADYTIDAGAVWKISADNTEYRMTGVDTGGSYGVILGNPHLINQSAEDNGYPFCWYNVGWGAWVGTTTLTAGVHVILKFERLVTS